MLFRISLCLLVTYFCSVAGSHTGVANAQTPPPLEARLTEWLSLLNRGDYEGLLTFHRGGQDDSTAERRALYDYRIYLMTHGFKPYKREFAPSGQVKVIAQEVLTGLWVSLLLKFSPQPPYTMVQYLRQKIGVECEKLGLMEYR